MSDVREVLEMIRECGDLRNASLTAAQEGRWDEQIELSVQAIELFEKIEERLRAATEQEQGQ